MSAPRSAHLGALVGALVGALAAGCGRAPSPAAPPHGQAPATEADRVAAATELLARVAAALRADRGLPALVDPVAGAWLWTMPGAVPTPSAHITAATAGSIAGLVPEGWTSELAAAIERGLAILDVDPPDPFARPYLHDCAVDDVAAGAAARAVLRTHGELATELRGYLADPGNPDVLAARATLAFRWDTAAVYLGERDGALAVVHLLLWYPCDA